MKNIKIISIIMFGFILESGANAQFCNSFPLSKGNVHGYQNLDSKGKVTSKSRTTCLDVSTDSSGTTIYKVKTEIADAKDVTRSSREYQMKCKNGKFSVDMKSFTDQDSMKEFDGLAVNVDIKDMEYPAVLSVGQVLPDAIVKISTTSKGAVLAETKIYTVTITNRNVIDIESVNVPVGTFDCFKITYDMEEKLISKKEYKVIEYISVGIGKVKTETFDKKDKLTTSSLLVELNK